MKKFGEFIDELNAEIDAFRYARFFPIGSQQRGKLLLDYVIDSVLTPDESMAVWQAKKEMQS